MRGGTTRLVTIVAFVVGSACANAGGSDAGEDPTEAGSTTFATTTSESGSSGDDGPSLLTPCDPEASDCPGGWKCIPALVEPFVIDSVCVPIPDDPLAPGDVCMLDEPLLNTGDSDPCGETSFCGSLGGAELEGECIELCPNGQQECSLNGYECVTAFDGGYKACNPSCDPTQNDCSDGAGCYPINGETFVCGPTLPVAGGRGTFCAGFHQFCESGLFCSLVPIDEPDCQTQLCCTEYCDSSAANTCPGQAAGEVCVPIFAAGQAPPGLEDIGGCGIE